MHEGVLILSKADKSVMFSNNTTKKLISKFLKEETLENI